MEKITLQFTSKQLASEALKTLDANHIQYDSDYANSVTVVSIETADLTFETKKIVSKLVAENL